MNLSFDVQKSKDSISTAQYDVIVMGAGPYGLSVSAHLQGCGLKVATFGKPIHFWRNHMPQGMLLRSYPWATNLSDPEKKYSIEQYFLHKGLEAVYPLPIETFIDYGLWFQENAVPNLDQTYIANIDRKDNHFLVTLEDGRVVESKAVVMAPGLHYYFYCPPEYKNLPSSLFSHSADHVDLNIFAGKRVAVIGRGQGALENAALLHEGSADVYVISRSPLKWLPGGNGNNPTWRQKLRSPRAALGNGWKNLFLEKFPYLSYYIPVATRYRVFDHHHGPIGASWLKSRILGQFPVKEQIQVTKVEAVNNIARLTLSDGEVLEVDHVILGTGYRTDVNRLPMLDASLRKAIQTDEGFPVLNHWFESSIPGLYFVGYSSLRSFGAFYRFVAGVGAASHRVSKAIARQVVAHSR
jgi:cation diffusion facilitator CzcD-associated flavoprotein CzcO